MVRDDDKVKRNVASNIAYYRRECNLTQAELAEKIFYSDKSVSKWERGDGVPDICVLVMLADLFGVTVNDLISDKQHKRNYAEPRLKRLLITLLSLGLVWLVAAVVFFGLKVAFPHLKSTWLTFIVAIPVTFIVAIVFTANWWPGLACYVSTSCLIWSIAVNVDVMIKLQNISLIYIIAAVLQVLVILWYLLKCTPLLSRIVHIHTDGKKADKAKLVKNETPLEQSDE